MGLLRLGERPVGKCGLCGGTVVFTMEKAWPDGRRVCVDCRETRAQARRADSDEDDSREWHGPLWP